MNNINYNQNYNIYNKNNSIFNINNINYNKNHNIYFTIIIFLILIILIIIKIIIFRIQIIILTCLAKVFIVMIIITTIIIAILFSSLQVCRPSCTCLQPLLGVQNPCAGQKRSWRAGRQTQSSGCADSGVRVCGQRLRSAALPYSTK
jgi:hypothetical protein